MSDGEYFNFDYTVKGSDRLANTLRKAGYDMTQLKAANRRAAEVVVSRAKSLVPVRSGALQGTIRVGATQKAAIVRAGNSKVLYAGVIEWGWPKRHIKAVKYVHRAADMTRSSWMSIYESAIDKALKEVQGDK